MATTCRARQVMQISPQYFADAPSVCTLQRQVIRLFVSITALVTFAVSHFRLTVYCVSLKCVIAASEVAVAEGVVSRCRGEMADF